MSRVFQSALQSALLLCALVAIISSGNEARWHWMSYAAKPLATLCVLLLAAATRDRLSVRYQRLVLAGIVMSLAGDVLLMLPSERLVAGLGFFLTAHCCFLAAFLSHSQFGERKIAFLAYTLVGSALFASIFPTVPPIFRGAVAAYVVAVTVMAAQGASWMLAQNSPSARLAAVGGAWFIVSDATFAIDRFRLTVPYRDLLVLGTYWIALWYVARSVSVSGMANNVER